MAQYETASYEVSLDGGETFTVVAEGLSFREAGHVMARVRDRRSTRLVAPDEDTYELHEVGGSTVWRWRTVALTTAG